MSEIGHNSDGQLKSLVERIEHLEEERAAVVEDIREVFKEAGGVGFNARILRKVIRLRKQSKADREEEMAMTERYLAGLGMI